MEQQIHNEIFKLEPSAMVVLFELVLKNHGKSYYFHAGENNYLGDIVFNGQTYFHIPIKAEGFEYKDKKLPRPKLVADNTDSFFSLKTRFFEDFIGYEVIRTRTFVRFLDAANFPNNKNPYVITPGSSYPPERYIINQKTAETANVIEFELTSPMEFELGEVPARDVVSYVCQWKYRGSIGCGYRGEPRADSKGNMFSAGLNNRGDWVATNTYAVDDYVRVAGNSNDPPDRYYICSNAVAGAAGNPSPSNDRDNWIADDCSKNISGCRLRFGATETTVGLPFGGFPGVANY